MKEKLSVVIVSVLLLVAFTLPGPVPDVSAGQALPRAGGQAPGQDTGSSDVPAGLSASEWQTLQEQVAKLTAADGADGDRFGGSVSISGDTAVVGAPGAYVDGNEGQGVVYIFYRNRGGPNAWGQVAKLAAADGAAGEFFGRSVSVSGDTVIIGAMGAAYVFYRDQGGPDAWGQVAKLTAADGAASGSFGLVSVSADTAVIGATHATVDGHPYQGAAYVFYRHQGGPDAWGQVAKLTAADGAEGDMFGGSVSLSGDTAVVGAEWANVGGNDDQGAAYVFYRNQGGPDAWGQAAKLTAADGAAVDLFGCSVAISGDTAVIGASAADVGGNDGQGAAYVFYRNQGGADAWGQAAKLTAADGAANDYFARVSISGNTAVVGAAGADVAGSANQGAAYVFNRSQGEPDAWGQVAKLTADDGTEDDGFGNSMSVSGGMALVGAPDVGGNPWYPRGAAYVFIVLAQGVHLDPSSQSGSGEPGATVNYGVTLTNYTGALDTFTLALGDHTWDTTLSTESLGPLADGESATFSVQVTVPADAGYPSSDTVVVTASSLADPTVYAEASLTTQAYAPPQMSVTPDALTSSQYVNEVTTQDLSIGNAGFAPLEFQLWIGGGSGVSFCAASTELYGYNVEGAWLRVVGIEDGTSVQVIDLDSGQVIAENSTLNRYDVWDVYPAVGTHYKVEADKRVVGYASDFDDSWSHNTFIPSLDAGPVGTEFVFYYHRGYVGSAVYVFAVDAGTVEVRDTSGGLIESRTMQAGQYWELALPNAVYRFVSSGRIAIESVSSNGYSTVPAVDGAGVGHQFYFGTRGDYFTGALAVFAYEATDVEVYDLDSGELLYSQHIDQGNYWWQTGVGTRRLRLESSGNAEVWAGDAEGGDGIENLGDDISFAGGRNEQEYWIHSLMDGSVLFAPFDNTTIDVDGIVHYLNKDEYLHLAGCCNLHHIQASQPILIQTLGRDTAWNDLGTYLGGVVGGEGSAPWLTINPTSGTVPGSGSTLVQVTFNATGVQPGVYTTEISVQSNDPATPIATIPVDMTVLPTPNMGWVEGTVSQSWTGNPVAATLTAAGQPYTVATDPSTGHYQLWLEAGSYTLQAISPGYLPQTAEVTVTAQQGVTQDFALSVDAPPPVAEFWFDPYDPSTFDTVQFSDSSYDTSWVGIESWAWDLGDGTTAAEPSPAHQYTADGDYTVSLTVTTADGRSASTSQVVQVRTHDVAIAKFLVPKAARVGQTRSIVVGISNQRYPERVEVHLYKSTPAGDQWLGSTVQSVPVRPARRTTDFSYTYTFTADDASAGTVTFRAVAYVVNARDARPADNEAISTPTKVTR